MKKSEDEPKKGAPAYMNTYGDMMTLLLTFFVLLFSMSSVDQAKFEQLVSSFSASMSIFEGGQTMNVVTNMLQNGMSQFPVEENILSLEQASHIEKELENTQEELSKYVKEQAIEDQVKVEKIGNEIVIRLGDVLLFDSGKAQLKAGAIPTLNMIGKELKKYLSEGYNIKIEGHTDNDPIRNEQFPSNWELSGARAIAVMRFYLEEMDFEFSKISYVGLGEYQPIASNDTKEGKAKNRRVEIKLSKTTK